MTNFAQRLGGARVAADQHYASALRAFEGRRLAEAQGHIESAIELLPHHAEYQAMLGWIHLQGDADGAAQAAFDSALDANPYEMLANYGKGMLAYREKQWGSAAGYFLDALAAQPERPETQYYLALVRHRQGENAHARQWMRAAQANFAKAKDEREQACQAWIREFDTLIRKEPSRAL